MIDATLISDTIFTNEPLRRSFLARAPFVWTGSSYIAATSLLITNFEGRDSYLVRHCPLTGVPSVNRRDPRPLEDVVFTASAHGGSPEYSYEWDFGDFTRPEPGFTRTHRYERPGTYVVTLITTDRAGAESRTRLIVTVGYRRARAARH
jgi:PKD repeat protein